MRYCGSASNTPSSKFVISRPCAALGAVHIVSIIDFFISPTAFRAKLSDTLPPHVCVIWLSVFCNPATLSQQTCLAFRWPVISTIRWRYRVPSRIRHYDITMLVCLRVLIPNVSSISKTTISHFLIFCLFRQNTSLSPDDRVDLSCDWKYVRLDVTRMSEC